MEDKNTFHDCPGSKRKVSKNQSDSFLIRKSKSNIYYLLMYTHEKNEYIEIDFCPWCGERLSEKERGN